MLLCVSNSKGSVWSESTGFILLGDYLWAIVIQPPLEYCRHSITLLVFWHGLANFWNDGLNRFYFCSIAANRSNIFVVLSSNFSFGTPLPETEG